MGAIGGLAVMTGGVSLIPTIIYGGCCAGSGAIIGRMLDKGIEEDEKNEKKNK